MADQDAWSKSQFADDYSDAKHEKNPHGIIAVDGKEVASTLMCPHCGAHFVSRKGWNLKCSRHNARVCENPVCRTFCTDIYPDMLSVSEV